MADVDLAIRARLAGWNSTCVHDVVRAYKLLLMQGKRGEIYNICSEGGSIIDIVMLFSNMYHMKVEVHQEQSEFRPMDNPRIVGSNKKIQKDLPSNVTLYGEVNVDELLDLYARCKAHICTALNEDYGLTPIEAMASGKAVVAVDEGGYRETVTDETGMLVTASVDSLVNAIKFVSRNPERYREACLESAMDFDLKKFSERLRAAIFEMDIPIYS